MSKPFLLIRIARGPKAAVCALWLVALIPIGCVGFVSRVSIPASVLASLRGPVGTSVAQYRAYGDSITSGLTLSGTEKPYPAFVAEYEGVTYADNALPGDQACDVPTRQVFPNGDLPTLGTHPTYTLLIGTNDAFGGAGPYEEVFKLCQQATISWLAIPAEFKVLGTGSGVTTTGAVALDTSNNWNAWTTDEVGASISFTITTSQPGPIYAWPRIIDGNPGTFTYSVDGVGVGSASTETTPSVATRNGSSNSLGFLRLPVVPAGTHVVTFTQTSEGPNGVSVVGIGTPARQATDQFPTVLVGTIPYQGSGSSCDSSHGACQSYILDIEAVVTIFSNDGLDVRLFDTRKFMFGSSLEMDDWVHPNELGQFELSHSVEASW